MSYNEREKKRRGKRRFRTLLISFIFLYLIFRSVPSLLANNAKTILPERNILIKKNAAQGFMIKNEMIARATSNGELELFSDEGVRLSAGTEVASISTANDSSSLKQELEQIEKSIIALEKSEADTEIMIKEKDKIGDVQESLGIEIQELINRGEFDQVYLLKEKLALYNNKSKEVTYEDTLLGQSLEKLNSRKKTIRNEIDSNHINYYTNSGGILSYEIDGYEEIYITKDFENYSYDKLNLSNIGGKEKKKKSDIAIDEPIYKIIDNFEWYMGIKIEDIKEIKGLEIKDIIRIEMKEDKKELLGRVIAINNSKNKAVIIIKFNTKLHEYYNNRFPEIYIIKDKIEGFKIPNKTIVEKDSVKGVYIKDLSGIVRFRPIKIVGEDGKYTHVDMGNSKSQIKLKDGEESVRTISIYDEIFLNNTNIREGQIIN